MLTDNYQNENIQSDNPGGDAEWQESKLKRMMDVFGCLFAVNVCFVISCLPIFTIGAAFTALYAMMFRIQRRDDYTVVREYFMEFKANFKKGTIAFLIILLICFIMWGQYTYVLNFEGPLALFYDVVVVLETVALALVVPFVFPLLAYFDNTVLNTFKNAFLLAVSNLGAWIKMFVAWFATIAFSFGYEAIILNTWYLWLLIIFGLLAYGTSLTAKRVFDLVDTTHKEKEEKDEEKKRIKEIEERKAKAPKRSIKEKQALVASMQARAAMKEDDVSDEEKTIDEAAVKEKSEKTQDAKPKSESGKKKNNKKDGKKKSKK